MIIDHVTNSFSSCRFIDQRKFKTDETPVRAEASSSLDNSFEAMSENKNSLENSSKQNAFIQQRPPRRQSRPTRGPDHPGHGEMAIEEIEGTCRAREMAEKEGAGGG